LLANHGDIEDLELDTKYFRRHTGGQPTVLHSNDQQFSWQ
jgi:hypothetical protein